MKHFSLIAVSCCLLSTGCGDPIGYIGQQFPTINDIEVTGAVHRAQPTVHVSITDPEDPDSNVVVTEVLLSYRSTQDENAPFFESGVMSELSASNSVTQFEGNLPALSLGSYEVRVQARVKYEPQSPDQPALDEQEGLLIGKTQAFNVSASEKVCFTFANDLEGWTFEGIYDGDDVENAYAPTCLELGFWDSNFGGSAALSLSCTPSEEPQSGFWAQDFVSPDLDGLSEWQGLQGLAFVISAQVTLPGSEQLEVQVQPILSYQDADGTPHDIVPVQSSGQPIFYSVEGPTTIEWSPQLAEDSTTTRLRVRVFIEYGMTVGETVCRLHTVCPSGSWITEPVLP